MPTPTSIKLDDALKNRVQHLADARRRSAHWIMCEAIAQYVEREEERESFKQDALRAWEAYQQYGQHLTLEEADAWLAELEEGEDGSRLSATPDLDTSGTLRYSSPFPFPPLRKSRYGMTCRQGDPHPRRKCWHVNPASVARLKTWLSSSVNG